MNNLQALVILGGAFDPIHLGHLSLANSIYQKFNLPVSFMPLNGVPNYKASPTTTLNQRLDMLKLAIQDQAQFRIEPIETTSNRYSPSYLTLQKLRQNLGNSLPIFFVIGFDSLVSLDTWDNWQELFNLTNFIAVSRTGYTPSQMSDAMHQEYQKRKSNKLDQPYPAHGTIYEIEFDPIDISSTHIRELVKNNQSINDLVTIEVAKYIKGHGLYARIR